VDKYAAWWSLVDADAGVVQRLAVYKSRGAKFFSAGSDQPCFLMSLNDNDLQGLLKGIQRRRVRYRFTIYVT